MEQQTLHDRFNLKIAVARVSNIRNVAGSLVGNPTGGNPSNAVLCGTVIQTFLCPADGTAPADPLTGGWGPAASASSSVKGAATNYDVLVEYRDWSRCNNWKALPSNERRMFGENSTTRVQDVQDGLSRTLMLGETTRSIKYGRFAHAWAYRGHYMPGIDVSGRWPGINLWHIPSEPDWRDIVPTVGVLQSWTAAAGSLHPGGCGFVTGDGAYRFIDESTDPTVLGNLCRMADGAAVTLP